MVVARLLWGTPRAAFGHLTSMKEKFPGSKTINKQSIPRDGDRCLSAWIHPCLMLFLYIFLPHDPVSSFPYIKGFLFLIGFMSKSSHWSPLLHSFAI